MPAPVESTRKLTKEVLDISKNAALIGARRYFATKIDSPHSLHHRTAVLVEKHRLMRDRCRSFFKVGALSHAVGTCAPEEVHAETAT